MGYEKAILGNVVGLQATALMGQNLRAAQDAFKPRQSPKKQMRNMVRTGVGTMLGIGLMKPTAEMINSL